MFFFVPETFWDRTPRPKKPHKSAFPSLTNLFHHGNYRSEKSTTSHGMDGSPELRKLAIGNAASAAGLAPATIAERRLQRNNHHVGFSDDQVIKGPGEEQNVRVGLMNPIASPGDAEVNHHSNTPGREHSIDQQPVEDGALVEPAVERSRSGESEKVTDYLDYIHDERNTLTAHPHLERSEPETPGTATTAHGPSHYTNRLRAQPPKTFVQILKPWNGRLRNDNWFKVALRPFILFAYPAILWSTLVYSLSIGWLIVLSETVSSIYRDKETYNFSALQTGLVYLSPFIGGVLGTAVAGKVSDIIVRFMSRRNGGIYEPEFRLVMAIPVMFSTCIGLMGFGWSAAEHDNWAVPTVFFGIISFGCSLGSTTSITFAVDSYRQYAGEALVTLNFSKNIFHGLVFSLFFNHWLESDGSKDVFLAIGSIQIACLLTTIPMYIFGKRARMWTVRKNLMEKF